MFAGEGGGAAEGEHHVFIEVVESAHGHGLGAVIGAHGRGELEFGARAVVVERMEAREGRGDRAHFVHFAGEVVNTIIQPVNAVGKDIVRRDTVCSLLINAAVQLLVFSFPAAIRRLQYRSSDLPYQSGRPAVPVLLADYHIVNLFTFNVPRFISSPFITV